MRTTTVSIATAISLAAAAASHAQVFATYEPYGPWTWTGDPDPHEAVMELYTGDNPSTLWIDAGFSVTGLIAPDASTVDGIYDFTITYNDVVIELSSQSIVIDNEPVQIQLGPIAFHFSLSIDLDASTTYEIPPLLPVTRINSYGLISPLNETEEFTVTWTVCSAPTITNNEKLTGWNAEAHLAGWIAVPEPAHLALLSGISLLAVAGWRRLSGASASGALRGNCTSKGRTSR